MECCSRALTQEPCTPRPQLIAPPWNFMQVLRRLFAIRGQPAKLVSDNGTQLVAAEKKLREMIKGWNEKELDEFCAEESVE